MTHHEHDEQGLEQELGEATEEARRRRGADDVELADDPGRAAGEEPLAVDEDDEEISAF